MKISRRFNDDFSPVNRDEISRVTSTELKFTPGGFILRPGLKFSSGDPNVISWEPCNHLLNAGSRRLNNYVKHFM